MIGGNGPSYHQVEGFGRLRILLESLIEEFWLSKNMVDSSFLLYRCIISFWDVGGSISTG